MSSFEITEHICTICKSHYEIWRNKETGHEHIHIFALMNKKIPANKLCKCRPLPNGVKK